MRVSSNSFSDSFLQELSQLENRQNNLQTEASSGLKLTLPLYHTDETKDQPAFKVSPANFANSVTLLVEYAGVNKSAASRPQDFYTLQYLPK